MKAMWHTRGRDGKYNLESISSVDVASKLADGPTADRPIDIFKPKIFQWTVGKLWTECLKPPPHHQNPYIVMLTLNGMVLEDSVFEM